MAKRTQAAMRSQPSHTGSKKSQPDRRGRLDLVNPERRLTERAAIPLTGMMALMVAEIVG